MESTKLSALLVLAMLALSSSPVALACNSCGSGTPSSGTPSTGAPSIGGIVGAVTPVIGGIVGKVAPVVSGVTPVAGGVVSGATPVAGGAVPVVGGVVGTVTPVVGGIIGGGSPVRHGGRKACPPSPTPPTPTPPTPTPPTPTPTPPSSDTCPIDALKLGVCVDLLGNDVHIGDTHVQCCPLLKGVAGLSAAACLCTTIKAKVLDISIYVPLALQLLLNCGCAVPPGYNCA